MPFDIVQFKRALVYDGQVSPAELKASLQEIREIDSGSERVKRMTAWIMILSVLAGIGLWVGFIVTKQKIPGLVLAALGCGLVFVIAMFYRLMKGKYDLPNRRYELVHDLAGMLGRDMAKDAAFDLKLDLARANDSRKKTGQDKVGLWDVTYYQDPWLSLSGRLVDGTAFEISMLDRVQMRKRWARSSSGKNKLKTKSKSATLASVNLFPKQKKYSNLPQVVDRTPLMLKLPRWCQVKKLTANPERLMVTTVTSEEWSVRRCDPKTQYCGTEAVTTMLLSLYQVLHTSKAASGS